MIPRPVFSPVRRHRPGVLALVPHLFLLWACGALAFGQALGDPGVEAPYTALAPRLDIPLSPVRTPEEQQQTFQLPPGFRIELVAAEPEVRDPVAVAFDLQGHLWVAEMSGFNAELVRHLPDLAGGVKAVPTGKVVRLQSSRGDGRYDRRTVFLDDLRSPRALAILHDGVLVADPPHLWHARDTDGDGRADQKTLVSENYGRRGDDEGSANGLLWGRDNVIHNASHPVDFRRHATRWEVIPVPLRGQFGISQDDFGRLYFTRNSQHLRADLFSPHYARRHPHVADLPWINAEVAKDQTVWPGRPTPAVNRGYKLSEPGSRNGGLRSDATLHEFTAACGTLIYRGANFPPSFYHNAFVPEPVANLVKRTILLESEGRMTAVNAYEGREFLTSTDERFRPVAAANAPDGTLIVVDMYRGIIEQYNFISSYLKDQTLKRGLHQPLHGQGRIWRIVHESGPRDTTVRPRVAEDPAALVRLLDHPNGWWRDAAQQALVESRPRAAVPDLESLAKQGETEATRVAALWTLAGMDALTPVIAERALEDRSGKVRTAAVRLHEPWLAATPGAGLLQPLLRRATDPDPAVTVQLALSLGEARTPAALDGLLRVLEVAGAHPYIPKAVANGLAGRELEFLDRMIPRLTLTPVASQQEILTVLATAIAKSGKVGPVDELLSRLTARNRPPGWARLSVLDGLALPSRPGAAPSPVQIRLKAALESLAAEPEAEISRKSRSLLRRLETAQARVAAPARAGRELTKAEKQLADYGRGAYAVCAACHQPDGNGLASVAPSLVTSKWVQGAPEKLIRILLHGKEGTAGFPGGMPSAASFTDMQIAGLLTYVRNAWGNQAGAIDVPLVTRVRKETIQRLTPWTDSELDAAK